MESADHCPAFRMTSSATPDNMALEVDAALQLWAVKVSVLTPLTLRVDLIHLGGWLSITEEKFIMYVNIHQGCPCTEVFVNSGNWA